MIAGLILAAGESRRMGRDKALLTYRGRTFLETLIFNLRAAAIDKITVVLGHHAESIQAAVDLGDARVVVNSNYRLGQTSSLQAGLAAMAADSLEAAVLCLVDHPAVSAQVIVKLIERFESLRPPVVIPTHKGQKGHPIVINRLLFPELLAIAQSDPANLVIRKYHATTEFVEVADAGILADIDNPADFEALTSRGGEQPSTKGQGRDAEFD